MEFAIPTSYIQEHLGKAKLAEMRAAKSGIVNGCSFVIQKGMRHATVWAEPRDIIELVGQNNAEIVWGTENLTVEPHIVDHDQVEVDNAARTRARWRRELKESSKSNLTMALA